MNKTRKYFIIIMLALMLGACEALEVTSTPYWTPSPESTAEATPTQEVAANPHAECWQERPQELLHECVVNANPSLDSPFSTTEFEGRAYDSPAGWGAVNHPGRNGVPAHANCYSAGCAINLEYVDGVYGWGTHITGYANQRYLIKVVYDVNLDMTIDRDLQMGDVDLYGVITMSSEQTVLTKQPVPDLFGYYEALWLIETDEPMPEFNLGILVDVPFAIFGKNEFGGSSVILIREVSVIAVPDDYGSESEVVRF